MGFSAFSRLLGQSLRCSLVGFAGSGGSTQEPMSEHQRGKGAATRIEKKDMSNPGRAEA